MDNKIYKDNCLKKNLEELKLNVDLFIETKNIFNPKTK